MQLGDIFRLGKRRHNNRDLRHRPLPSSGYCIGGEERAGRYSVGFEKPAVAKPPSDQPGVASWALAFGSTTSMPSVEPLPSDPSTGNGRLTQDHTRAAQVRKN